MSNPATPLSDPGALAMIRILEQASDSGTRLPVDVLNEAARQLVAYAHGADPAVARVAYNTGREAFRTARQLRLEEMEGPWAAFLRDLGLPADGYPFEPVKPSLRHA